jgi:dTDP-4-amino-4,6-dideoxygalactose transaminase
VKNDAITAVAQCDPMAGYLAYKTEIDAAINNVLNSGRYILGRQVEDFEREFALYTGSGFGVGVANGTDAIEIALRALDIGAGDLVFTVSHTAVATVAAIERCGANPVFIDIERTTMTMDPNRLNDAIRNKSSVKGRPAAIIPVHLYGGGADMAAIMNIAGKNNLPVIEDCAQAHGAVLNGQKAGSFGQMAAFSFYPTKNLGAIGDGGMVVTIERQLREKLMALRQYGWQKRYVSSMRGINSRLDELQAAILRVKLRYLEDNNTRRRQIAEMYDCAIENKGIVRPRTAQDAVHVYHQYVIRTEKRDSLMQHLADNSIATAVHYPLPVHLQPAYKDKVYPGNGGLSVTEEVCGQILSLPMYPQMTDDQVGRVTDALCAWAG